MTDVATSATPAPAPQNPPKKSSLGKKILKLFALLLILFVIGLVVLFLNLNTLVRAGVVRGGQYATDQTTSLDSADLSFSKGSLALNGLDIDNLKGYSAPKILSMKNCAVTVDSGSIFTHTVSVPSITIAGLEVTLEQNGMKNNLNDLMDVIQKKTPATGNAQNSSPGKELKIGVIKMTGTIVHVRANPVNMDLNLPDLEITDPTNPDGRPMKIADLMGKILVLVGKQIVENPQIPGDIKGAMKNVTAVVDNLKGELDKGVKTFATDLQNVTKNLPDAGKGIQDASKGLQDAGKNLGNLFNQNKQQGK
jgi:hypothetical protein